MTEGPRICRSRNIIVRILILDVHILVDLPDVEVCLSVEISTFGEICHIAWTLRTDDYQSRRVAPSGASCPDTWGISPL